MGKGKGTRLQDSVVRKRRGKGKGKSCWFKSWYLIPEAFFYAMRYALCNSWIKKKQSALAVILATDFTDEHKS